MDQTCTLQNLAGVLAKALGKAADLREIARIRNRAEEELVDAVAGGVPAREVGLQVAGINDALMARLIAIAEASLEARGLARPAAGFTWLSLGSQGRAEQILRTEQDNALLFDDPAEEDRAATHTYYAALAAEVCAALQTCGFPACPGNNMASNPKWCQPLAVWKDYFSQWIRVPEDAALLNAAVVFDFRPSAGVKSLACSLREHITAELQEERGCLVYMARNVLRNPPARGFWGRMLVERGGTRKGLFDVKLRAMKPVTDAARLLALDNAFHADTGTLERLERCAGADPLIREILPSLALAYETFMRSRVLFGVRGKEGGRYLELARINEEELQRVRRSIGAVKNVLKMVQARYQIDPLGLT